MPEASDVTDLDTYRPHVVIETDDGVDVYPVAYFQDMLDGKREMEIIEDTAPAWKTILQYWLSQFETEK